MDGVFVFLDVEGPPHQSLVEEYYRAWSDAIIAAGNNDMIFRDVDKTGPINFWPCVYGAEGDDQTWNSLFAANNKGCCIPYFPLDPPQTQFNYEVQGEVFVRRFRAPALAAVGARRKNFVGVFPPLPLAYLKWGAAS
jgi:hypothetical protein